MEDKQKKTIFFSLQIKTTANEIMFHAVRFKNTWTIDSTDSSFTHFNNEKEGDEHWAPSIRLFKNKNVSIEFTT